MSKKIDNLVRVCQGNAYPAMVATLSAHLNVSADSLTRLGVGWAPVVNFKKGPNFDGWWAIPEVDADGVPVGIGLRSQNDFKVMAPGSKHGLIYEVNPGHERGVRVAEGSWIRTMDAGVLCPICSKPDGCLVNSETLDDPDGDAVCIRVKEGAIRPLKMGYLHSSRKGKRRGTSALLDSDLPVLIVEGMTDAATAMDMGFVAVGRPSNLACMGMLGDLLRGRKVVIVGENDEFNEHTQSRPGHEGMIAAFQTLRKLCPGSKMVLPPEHMKDLRQWRTQYDLTADDFMAWVDKNGKEHTQQVVLPDDQPITVARAWLDDTHRMAGRYTLRYFKGQWFAYDGDRYIEVDAETAIRGSLYGWCEDKKVPPLNPDSGLQPLVCNRGLVGNVLDALLNPCPVDSRSIPTWINNASGPNPADLIPFTNGLLWVPKYLEGAPFEEYMLEPTPDYFTTFCLPFPFDPTADCPRWRAYLRSTLPDERDKVHLMREWYGYCLTPDTSFHKLMLFRGPKRSGKSTALAVLNAIVGEEQCGTTSFAQLPETFGLEGLVGKQIVTMGDARLPRGGDSARALEILLNVVGEDPMNVNRKFLKPLANHRLTCRFTLASNELPELPDHAGALEARLNIIDFRQSFVGREDFGLRDRLVEEAPGIVVWALEGLRRLRKRGKFTLPEASKESLREWRTTTSPTAAFLEECCDEEEGVEVSKTELFDAWTGWARERGIRIIAKSRFFERLKANAQYIHSETYEKGGHKFSVFKGLKLKRWAAKQYTGNPG